MDTDEKWLLTEKYGGVESEAFHADVARLKTGEPLAFIIGHVPFLDTTIYLDSQPLIPRPETEFWVEKAIKEIGKTFHSNERFRGAATASPRLLDLCAGSGAIGVAVAKAIPEAHVTFGEIDTAHLPTIAKNLKENEIDCTRYQVLQSDLFENITGKFDFILCNPPYIDPALDRTEHSVKNFEPHIALYGGRSGLELIEKIIATAHQYLTPTGQLWLEHEPEQARAISTLAEKSGLTSTTHLDQYNIARYSVIRVR